MAIIEESIHTKCPVDKLFTYTINAGNWPIWQLIIVDAEQTSKEKIGIGTTFKGIVRMMDLIMNKIEHLLCIV